MSVLGALGRSTGSARATRSAMPMLDIGLLVAVMALVLFGLLMVYSASIALADGPRYQGYGRFYFVGRHALFIAIGLLGAGIVAAVPMRVWHKLTVPLFVCALLLLVLVLVPGLGREVNGARRWLPLGLLNFQPSELMKFAMMLYAAVYVVRKQSHLQGFVAGFVRGFLPIALALIVVGVLLLLEPDLGAFIVIGAIAVGILFIGGINLKLFTLMLGGVMSSFLLLIWLSPWRRERLFVYLDPWNPDNAYGSAYQLSHSLIALGRGEWFGVGLGASIEKLHYLPEAHTDFIVAVIGEELGLVGLLCLMAVFVFIVLRAFDVARQAMVLERAYESLVAQGVALWIGVQAFINVGVCLGLLPTKGLTLPLVSYGGSGIVMNLAAMALLLRIDHEMRCLMRGKRR